MTDAPVAAIDMGTNSTRLLVHDGEHTIERLMTITRLGQDVDRTGRLADEAIERVLSCLRTYKSVMDQHGVTRVQRWPPLPLVMRPTATSSSPQCTTSSVSNQNCCRASTKASFLPRCHRRPRSPDGPFLVFDIGGGSTEFAFGTDEAEAAMSLDIGCVRLTEKYVEHDPPRPEELVACLSITEAHLDDVARQMPQIAHAATFVGLAGTVSTAAAVELGLAEYDRDQIHHFVLTKEAAEDVYRTLVTEARKDRIHNPGLEEARADVIVGGMCILVRIMRYFDIEELVVSEADILDGLVFSLLSPPSS